MGSGLTWKSWIGLAVWEMWPHSGNGYSLIAGEVFLSQRWEYFVLKSSWWGQGNIYMYSTGFSYTLQLLSSANILSAKWDIFLRDMLSKELFFPLGVHGKGVVGGLGLVHCFIFPWFCCRRGSWWRKIFRHGSCRESPQCWLPLHTSLTTLPLSWWVVCGHFGICIHFSCS